MMRRFLRWLVSHMQPPRVIYDRAGVSSYLSRYYLIGGPYMPDGSPPFEPDGALREGVVWPLKGFGVYLHKFHRGDEDHELHNHPWRWAVALILSGGYLEERRGKDDVVRTRRVRPWTINVIRSNDFHRVELLDVEAWSLFIAGPKFQGWGFWNRVTGVFLPWREFINRRRDPAAFQRDTP